MSNAIDLPDPTPHLFELFKARVHAEVIRTFPTPGEPITEAIERRAISLAVMWTVCAAAHQVSLRDVDACVNLSTVALDAVRNAARREHLEGDT